MKKLVFMLALIPSLLFAQTVPNAPAGVFQGEVWTVTQWINAWQSKADTNSAALTGAPTINGAFIPSLGATGVTGQCVQWASPTTIKPSGLPCGGGGGGTNITGTPASGNLTVFSGIATITNGDLTGDVTTSGSTATTVGKVNGATVPVSAAVVASNSSSQLSAAPTTGTGNVVLATGPTLTLGNATGLPFNGVANGTNTNTLTVGTGGSIVRSGTAIIDANQINSATVPASAAVVASNSSKQLTALTLGGNLGVVSGVLQTSQAVNAQTGTSYAIVAGDQGKLLTFKNAAAIAVSLAQAGTTGFTTGFSIDVENLGAGLVTITPATSTINGVANLAVPTNTGCTLTSDGTNYQVSACTAVATVGFIAGSFTSTQVLNSFAPALYGGSNVNTTDMGLLTGDGARWLVGPAPPPPPGAAVLGYNRNVYTVLPVVADISINNSTKTRLYSGYGPLGYIPPLTAYSTASNGQLQMQYPSGGPLTAASIVTTENAVNSQLLPGNLEYLPYLLGSQGFYVEFAVTSSSNNTNVFFSPYLEPQEKNTTQNDHVPGDLPGLERWLEFDVNESGHGSDFGGGNKGAVHYGVGWTAGTSGNTTFTASLTGLSSGATLTIATGGAPGGGNVWPIDSGTYSGVTSTAQSINVTFTKGSATATLNTTITGSPNAVDTVRFANKVVSFTNATVVDYTVEHIFGLSYDPIGNAVNWYMDGVSVSGGPVSLSPFGTDLFPGVNAWHWFPILACQSHDGVTAYTTNVRYFSAWTP